LNNKSFADGESRKSAHNHKSKLISFGITPMGVISIGIAPMGVICIGVVPMGVVGIGVVSMGAITASIVGMGLVSAGFNTMSVITASPLSKSRVDYLGSKIQASDMQHDHEVLHEMPKAYSYLVYENEALARASADLIGCNEIRRVGDYWAPCDLKDVAK
jgi:hypothetical protein